MDWLTSFRLGKMTLADALFFHLSETGAHPNLIEAYVIAISDYQEGKVSDLADGFGIVMSKRQKNKIQKSVKDDSIKKLVEELSRGERVSRVDLKSGKIIEEVTKAPLPKKSLEYDGSVYKEVGKLVGMSGETVRDICRNKKKNQGG